MHRTMIAGAAALVFSSLALADDAFVRQIGYDRPGGAYISLPTEDATACAAQCARDGLCLAWSYQPTAGNSCALKAVVTPARLTRGVTSGLAARAARFASLVGAELPPPPAKPESRAVIAASPAKDIRPPAAPRPIASAELLGGPDDAL